MRTTLDIDDAVLAAVKDLAHRQQRTAGEVLSTLARQALTDAAAGSSSRGVREPRHFYFFESFSANGKVVTNEHIDDLRDREGV
ncbi:MAG: hypothetical protein U1F11_05500 [Steroidobacteraceae bacterium]